MCLEQADTLKNAIWDKILFSWRGSIHQLSQLVWDILFGFAQEDIVESRQKPSEPHKYFTSFYFTSFVNFFTVVYLFQRMVGKLITPISFLSTAKEKSISINSTIIIRYSDMAVAVTRVIFHHSTRVWFHVTRFIVDTFWELQM